MTEHNLNQINNQNKLKFPDLKFVYLVYSRNIFEIIYFSEFDCWQFFQSQSNFDFFKRIVFQKNTLSFDRYVAISPIYLIYFWKVKTDVKCMWSDLRTDIYNANIQKFADFY